MKKVIILIFTFCSLYANSSINKTDIHQVEVGTYKIIEFDHMLKDIKVSDSKKIKVDFMKDTHKKLRVLKLFGKEIGQASMLITFDNDTKKQIQISIVKNLNAISGIITSLFPDIKILRAAKSRCII